MRTGLVVPVLASLVLALSGCGSDEGVLPPRDGQGRYVIHGLGSNQFEPAEAHVPVGSTVVWVNQGGYHDVSADDGSFSSADTGRKDEQGYPLLLAPGESWAHTFNETGRFVYWCHTHHEFGMKGVLVVTES